MRRIMKTSPPDRFIRPPRLRPGSRVALVSPAGPSPDERIDAAIERCRVLGFEPEPGAHARARDGYLAGTDEQRLADLDAALRDPSVSAIWAVRGGYGTMRLLERLDLAPLRDAPRAFIGFSDNTAVHLLFARNGMVSFHGPHAGAAFPDFTREAFELVVCRSEPPGILRLDDARGSPALLREGVAEGRLMGGNLTMLAAACGTSIQLDARGAIVVIEDVNEPAYRVDRALTQLLLAGCFDGVRGFAFGCFEWTDAEAPGAASIARSANPALEDVLADRVRPLLVPAVAGLPFGHVDRQWTLPLGVHARLDAIQGTLEILEPAVA
jgi:muramoyltetrapeptide carboxypeptidase